MTEPKNQAPNRFLASSFFEDHFAGHRQRRGADGDSVRPRGRAGRDRDQDRLDRLRRPRHRRRAGRHRRRDQGHLSGPRLPHRGRGRSAEAEKKNIKVVALADLFEDRLARCRAQLAKLGIEVPKQRCFMGFDAYKQLLAEPEVNYVILATPPHFRPLHLKAAIEAGKHVFMEKPAAVDVPGVKLVMEAGELAKQKKLGIAAGTQRRHMKSYQETIKRIRDGAIGEIVYANCYWNGGQIWVIDRQPGWSDLEWQLRNWNYFTWLSGDHFLEQHVHNLDVMNWVLGSHPDQGRFRVGRPPSPHRRAARPYLRPLCRRVRVSQRRDACSAKAGRSTAA